MKTVSASRRAKGFTLIEIMVVIGIIAALAALVVPNVIQNKDEALVVTAKANIDAIETALDLYRLKHNNYPSTDEGLEALVEGRFLKKMPTDPWNKKPYLYVSPGDSTDYEVYTLGADGAPGGDGRNADINSATLE